MMPHLTLPGAKPPVVCISSILQFLEPWFFFCVWKSFGLNKEHYNCREGMIIRFVNERAEVILAEKTKSLKYFWGQESLIPSLQFLPPPAAHVRIILQPLHCRELWMKVLPICATQLAGVGAGVIFFL